MKSTSIKFDISRCEYSESFIKIYFKKNNSTKLGNVGELSFILEMSNDEIKREAFKFSGLFNLKTKTKKKDVNIYLKPKKIKTKLISIKHNFLPKTLIEALENLEDFIIAAEKEMKEDILELNKIDNPDKLRFYLLRKIEKSQQQEILKYKAKLKRELNTKISNINQLLVLMGKIDEIVSDLEAKEYLRYLFYDIFREKGISI